MLTSMFEALTHYSYGYLTVMTFDICFQEHFMWNCFQLNTTAPRLYFVNVGLGSGVLPPSKNLLCKLIST